MTYKQRTNDYNDAICMHATIHAIEISKVIAGCQCTNAIGRRCRFKNVNDIVVRFVLANGISANLIAKKKMNIINSMVVITIVACKFFTPFSKTLNNVILIYLFDLKNLYYYLNYVFFSFLVYFIHKF